MTELALRSGSEHSLSHRPSHQLLNQFKGVSHTYTRPPVNAFAGSSRPLGLLARCSAFRARVAPTPPFPYARGLRARTSNPRGGSLRGKRQSRALRTKHSSGSASQC
eukprot:4392403-Pleurochrysis_carterae.AAC.3